MLDFIPEINKKSKDHEKANDVIKYCGNTFPDGLQ